MLISTSAEAITKHLRSKTISTGEVYEIAQRIQTGKYEFYFPNSHIFILELIIDRWNASKDENFKKDWKIWSLFISMCNKVQNPEHKKKLLKNLKFVNFYLESLELLEEEQYELFPKPIFELLKIMNSALTIQSTSENAMKMMGGTLNLLLKSNDEDIDLQGSLLSELTALIGVQNLRDSSSKMTAAYVNNLLFPSLRYMHRFTYPLEHHNIDFLSNIMGNFLFNDISNAVKHLEKVINNDMLYTETMEVLFSCAIQHLSSSDIEGLEQIFKLLVKVDPKASSDLLKYLASSNRTLSQKFLEGLFEDGFLERNWFLMCSVLNLDIEIGIINTDRLIVAICSSEPNQIILDTWSKLVACHVNAREFSKFLDKWKQLCANRENIILLNNDQFSKVISDHVPSLSVSQLTEILDELVNEIIRDKSCHIVKCMTVVVLGLKRLSYTILQELRLTLEKIFEISDIQISEFWNLRYDILEIYDDITSEELLSEYDVTKLLKRTESPPITFYFNLFKLRELKEFDMSYAVNRFMQQINKLEELKPILFESFARWSTIIDLTFDKSSIEALVKLSLKQENIDIYDTIFLCDDIFEEQNITYNLTRELSENIVEEKCLKLLLKVPVQCINKNIRVATINNIVQKDILTECDLDLICHLLSNPTFKSNLETDFDQLLRVASSDSKQHNLNHRVFETVWSNHVNNMNAEECKCYVLNGINNLMERMLHSFDFVTYRVAFYAIRSSSKSIPEFASLRDLYISGVIDHLKKSKVDGEHRQISWILQSLYLLFSSNSELIKQQDLINLETHLSKYIKMTNDVELLESFFLFCSCYYDNLLFLLTHYVVLRSMAIEKANLIKGIHFAIQKTISHDVKVFNSTFLTILASFPQFDNNLTNGVLELYESFINTLSKSNVYGVKLFRKSVSAFYTYCENFIGDNPDTILNILNTYKKLLGTNPWLFSQYTIELLFPMCSKLNFALSSRCRRFDAIFIATTQLLSSILLFHRYKLSNRHHVVNSTLCSLLEVISNSKKYELSYRSAKYLSRLITNFCEPSNISSSNTRGTLNSKIAVVKRSLRKYLPVLLLKYIHISITNPFEANIRKELIMSVYAIFDVLSQEELVIVNSNLDNAGRTYFKSLYSEYKRVGKWHED
ncbi:ribosome biogenesis protein URB2 Ecym_1377 [Eremothecium cymbalariae DBVPG|uniref:Nucleolar 27S pre-rRNA processing Urb2/Npa2 C-terminal domain-containing protein n=1 Tax=Eremothecium cymbalariae (strain CBS 270.75 / DBVPG 7215 / KCTC 17166 / NRRL Y-17582) TaxID=931890 RepID=G8JNE6_ERECY|nr:hypothetical protein Ecym_1377 [Eremothecium cymbalariae DBVPG\